MRAYYVDVPLSESDLSEVAELMREPVEQVRIPHVLPIVDSARPILDDDAILDHLKKAGVLRDVGRRVLLVAPREPHWVAAFGRGIQRLTGRPPYLVQTEAERASIGNPGSLRILDMDGLAGGSSDDG
jgi:hypothetical protein